MAFKDTPTVRQATIKAVALGATHAQRWEVLHNGHWHLSSVAFFDMGAPCEAAGCAVEVATWQAGMESFSPLRRPSMYANGSNADKADKDMMAISRVMPIADEFFTDGEGAI